MENYLADDVSLDLQLDSSSKESLENGSWWARLMGIIYISILAMVLLIMIFYIQFIGDQLEYRLGINGAVSVIWIVMGIVLLFAGIILAVFMSFATKTYRGIRQSDQNQLESGLASFKTYLIIMGVLSILSVIFTLIGLMGKA